MRFWDASALVALVMDDAFTADAQKWIGDDPEVAVWYLTATEIWSAVARRRRDGRLGSPALRRARESLAVLSQDWHAIDDIQGVQQRAVRILDGHPLRTADALQLGAALLAVDDFPGRAGFVTFDARLAMAAEVEGFTAIGAEPV